MASVNQKAKPLVTYEGGLAHRLSNDNLLRKLVLTCMLNEDRFYESGEEIMRNINEVALSLINSGKSSYVYQLACEAKEVFKLRHVPLYLLLILIRHGNITVSDIERLLTRPDDLTELLALYWADKRVPIASKLKKALARAIVKFDDYQIIKYAKKTSRHSVKLSDIIKLTHPRPQNDNQALLFKQVIENRLPMAMTWEALVSQYKNKPEIWEILLSSNKLGTLALIRNLRNMIEAGVNSEHIIKAINNSSTKLIFPHQYFAAIRSISTLLPVNGNLDEFNLYKLYSYTDKIPTDNDILSIIHALENKMQEAVQGVLNGEKITGKTILLVDVSGSMANKVSSHSTLCLMDLAAALVLSFRCVFSKYRIFTFSNDLIELNSSFIKNIKSGLELANAIVTSQGNNGTYLGKAITTLNNNVKDYDRIVVITDEQIADTVPSPNANAKGYIVNIAPYKSSFANNDWTHINGFSEQVIRYIYEVERLS